MVRRLLHWFVVSIPVIYLLLALGIVFFIQQHSYEYILAYYPQHWPTAFDVTFFARRCLTPQWYAFITGNALLLETVFVLALAAYFLLIKTVKKGVQQLLDDVQWVMMFMKQTLRGLSGREKWLLLGLFVLTGCYRLYFFVQFPMHPDEACSYLFFARQGTFMAAANYVTTNNHILLNVVCSFLAKLSFLGPKWVMRLPAMVGDIGLLLGIFCLVKHFSHFARAFWIIAGIAFCYIISYYATQGRGYQWQEICTVVSAGGCWWYFFSPAGGRKKGYGLFIAASVAGFYLNPLYVYPFLTLMLAAGYLFLKRKNSAALFSFVKAGTAIVLFTFILYLPLIMANSWKALVNNEFISGHQHISALASKVEVGNAIFAFNYGVNYGSAGVGILMAGLIFSLVLYYRRIVKGDYYRMMLVWLVASFGSFILVTLYQKVYPLERAMCFWILMVDLVFLNVLYDCFNRFFPNKAVLLFALFVSGKALFSMRTIYWSRYAIDKQEQVAISHTIKLQFDELMAMGATTWQVTNSDDYYSMFLPIYLIEHNKRESIILNRDRGVADVIFLPDTYQQGFDLNGFILWKDMQVTSQGNCLRVYAKKKLIDR